MKLVVTSYQVLEPSFLSNASHLLFPSQMLSIKTSFREKTTQNLKPAKEMASFLIVENASLVTTYPDVCTAHMMYMTVPVTVAMAERFFFLNSN